MLLASSIQYCTSYMGCTKEDLDKYADVTIVVLALIADSYEVRQFTTSTITLNPLIQGVLVFTLQLIFLHAILNQLKLLETKPATAVTTKPTNNVRNKTNN